MTSASHITLIGFMGTGKSTVGRLLAERMGWDFVDADLVIAEKAGKSIPAIFGEDGELAFRKLEAQIYASYAGRTRVVVAAGGGAMILDETATRDRRIRASSFAWKRRRRRSSPASPWDIQKTMTGRCWRSRTRSRGSGVSRASVPPCTRRRTHRQHGRDDAGGGCRPDIRLARPLRRAAVARKGRVEALSSAPGIVPPIIDAPNAAAIVRTASGEYPAYVEWGALDRLGEYTKRATGARVLS